MDIRNEMMLTMIELRHSDVEAQHHEVATAGQCEIDMRFAPLVKMADQMMLYKYIVKNVARSTARPSPSCPSRFPGQRLRHARPLACGKTASRCSLGRAGYAGLSDTGSARHRRHAEARAVVASPSPTPTTNSYKRLVPGYEAPVNLVYSQRNRSAAVRIPMYSSPAQGEAHRVPLPGPELQPVPRIRQLF